jgi:hypothetical protein
MTFKIPINANPGPCAKDLRCLAVPKNCLLALFLALASGLAAAVTQPCNLTAAEFTSMNGDFSADVHAVRNYESAMAGMLKAEKFEQLDCLADHARSGKERLPGGAWKLYLLYGGLWDPVQYPVTHATREDWNAHLQHLQSWVTARPQSVTARIALARAYLNYAYDARGEGTAGTVSETGWRLFGQRTAEAKRILEEASALPTKCPEWYFAMLLVAQNQSWEPEQARALFDEAFKLEPGYFYDARILANYLLPKWSGAEGDTEKFIQEIADRIAGEQGDIFYFQVAIAPHLFCGCPGDPHLSMARIERGFEATEKQYGVSMMNLNKVALAAVRTNPGDPIFADKVLTRIGEQWDEETWTEKKDFDTAKSFSAFMAKRLTIEIAADTNMQTPEGLRYKASIEKPYKELVQQCVQPGGGDTGKFKSLIDIGAKGAVEDSRIYGRSAATHCIYEKLRALQQQKAIPFPPPPQAPYWVRIDLDWAEFTAVAAN